MVNFNTSVNFRGLITSPVSTTKNIIDKKTVDSVELNRPSLIYMPHFVTPYSENITKMQEEIDSITQDVQKRKGYSEKNSTEVTKLYNDIKNSNVPKNVIFSSENYKGSEYMTIAEKDNSGMVKRISHLKDGKIQTIYRLMSDLSLSDSDLTKHIEGNSLVNCYYYANGRCVEFIRGINNRTDDIKSNLDFILPDGQWPCRSLNNVPVSKVIVFNDNGGYKYYDSYLMTDGGKYKKFVSYDVDKRGNISVSYKNDEGFSYKYQKDSKSKSYPQYKLSVNKSIGSKLYTW